MSPASIKARDIFDPSLSGIVRGCILCSEGVGNVGDGEVVFPSLLVCGISSFLGPILEYSLRQAIGDGGDI